MARDRYTITDTSKPYFLTCTVVQWLPLFANRTYAQILLDSLLHMQQHERMIIYAYVILENHLHLIAKSKQLAKLMGRYKSFTARKIIDHLKQKNAHDSLQMLNFHKLRHKTDRDYQLWQEGSHPICIASHDIMRQKVTYIHNNPVKRGYIDDPIHWRYSSARNYAGLPGLIDVQTEW